MLQVNPSFYGFACGLHARQFDAAGFEAGQQLYLQVQFGNRQIHGLDPDIDGHMEAIGVDGRYAGPQGRVGQ